MVNERYTSPDLHNYRSFERVHDLVLDGEGVIISKVGG